MSLFADTSTLPPPVAHNSNVNLGGGPRTEYKKTSGKLSFPEMLGGIADGMLENAELDYSKVPTEDVKPGEGFEQVEDPDNDIFQNTQQAEGQLEPTFDFDDDFDSELLLELFEEAREAGYEHLYDSYSNHTELHNAYWALATKSSRTDEEEMQFGVIADLYKQANEVKINFREKMKYSEAHRERWRKLIKYGSAKLINSTGTSPITLFIIGMLIKEGVTALALWKAIKETKNLDFGT